MLTHFQTTSERSASVTHIIWVLGSCAWEETLETFDYTPPIVVEVWQKDSECQKRARWTLSIEITRQDEWIHSLLDAVSEFR